MRTHTAKHFLRNLTHNPLQIIETDDIANILQPYQPAEHHGNRVARHSAFTSLHSSQSGLFKIPMTPLVRKTNYSLRLQKTPTCKKQKLINLSFSQPSSPKTPLLGTSRDYSTPHLGVCKTPSIAADFVPCTPMITNPLQVLNQTNNAIIKDNLDILQLIDDDSRSVEIMESRIKMFTETELNDENVVDYLLDLSQEEAKENVQQKSKHSLVYYERPRRKCRHAKPVTKEEQESLRKLQKEKAKEKRKQRRMGLHRERTATRRSNRRRQPVQRFTV